MRLYAANLINELQKLAARKKYIVFFLIEVAICVLNVLLKLLVSKIANGAFQISIQNMAMGMQSFFLQIWIPLIVFLASADLFGTEFQDSSIKAVLCRPISRFKVYLSKLSAVFAVGVICLFGVFVTSMILEGITVGSIAGFGTALGAYLLDCLPLLVLVLMAALINQFGKSATVSMFLCIIVYMVLQIGGIFIPQLSGLLFTGYLQWHNIWLGTTLPFGTVIGKIALLLGYGLVFFSGGNFLFLRREV